MFVGPACFFAVTGSAEGVGVIGIGIVMVGETGGAGGDEAASARSLRRQATIATAITTTANAINAARARDRSTGPLSSGQTSSHRTPAMGRPIARRSTSH